MAKPKSRLSVYLGERNLWKRHPTHTHFRIDPINILDNQDGRFSERRINLMTEFPLNSVAADAAIYQG